MANFKKGLKKKSKEQKKGSKSPAKSTGGQPEPEPEPEIETIEVPISTPTYKQIREEKENELETENLFGGSVWHPSTGSFRNEGDNRSLLTREANNKRCNLNIGYSYTYNNMHCCCCKDPHKLLGKKVAPVLVLSDQCFPAAVPTTDSGNCMGILRIENGRLDELVDHFLSKMRLEWLPPGTVVLIGSPSQLAKDGLTTYTEDYTKAVTRLLENLPSNSIVCHAPPILFNGSNDRGLIRSLFELNHWLTKVEGSNRTLFDLAMSWADLIHNSTTGSTQDPYQIKLVLPKYLDLPLNRKIFASEPAAPLPAAINPVSQETETAYLEKVIQNLNCIPGVKLGDKIAKDREKVTKQAAVPTKSKFLLFVGDDAAAGLYSMAKAHNHACGYVPLSKIDNPEVTGASSRVASICKNLAGGGTDTIVIYSLFSRYAYMSQEGQRSTTDSDDKLHVTGAVCYADNKQLDPIVKRCLPVLDSAGENPKIVISPLPAFTEGPCCSNPGHAINAGTPEFKTSIWSGLSGQTRAVKEIMNANGIRRYRCLNLASSIMEMPATIAWTNGKPSTEAYSVLLDSILAEADSVVVKRSIPPPHRPEPKRRHSEPERNRYTDEDHHDRSRARERHHSHQHTTRSDHSDTGSSGSYRYQHEQEPDRHEDRYRYRY